jgi:hypothetical protein
MDLDWERTLVQRLDLSSDLDSAEKLERVIVGFSGGGLGGGVIGAAVGSGLNGEVGVTLYNPVHVNCSMGSKMPSYIQGFQYFHSKKRQRIGAKETHMKSRNRSVNPPAPRSVF